MNSARTPDVGSTHTVSELRESKISCGKSDAIHSGGSYRLSHSLNPHFAVLTPAACFHVTLTRSEACCFDTRTGNHFCLAKNTVDAVGPYQDTIVRTE